MNIFLHEFKAYRKSMLMWAIAMAAIACMYFAIYPSFSKDVVELKKMLDGYPEGVRKALGLSIESFTTILGFYGFIFNYILLCGGIQGMNLGLSILSKELREKTADFLLTKPVSREKILTAKLLSAIVSLIITNIIYITIAITMARVVSNKGYNMKIFILISLTLLLVQLIFFAIGLVISVVAPKIKSIISISLGIVFSFFIISLFGSVIGEKTIRYITPFKYFDNTYIINNASYEPIFLILEILIICVAISASYVIYMKKDIHAV